MPCEHFSVRRRFSLVEIKFRVPFLYYECPSAYLFVIVIYVFTFFFSSGWLTTDFTLIHICLLKFFCG